MLAVPKSTVMQPKKNDDVIMMMMTTVIMRMAVGMIKVPW